MFGSLSDFDSDLFDEFRRMQREVGQLFGTAPRPLAIRAATRGAYPPINLGSTPEQVDVYLFAAGVQPESLDIAIQQNLLTISGERRLTTEEGANYYRRERFDGSFRRVVTLPEDVDPDRVDARYRDGVLHITIQRRESAKRRQIKVQ